MKLCDAPVGLFLFGDTLCLMTEYSSSGCGREAYIVSSGEMFWGGAKSKEERANLDVTPVTVRPGDLRPKGQWEVIEDYVSSLGCTVIDGYRCSLCKEESREALDFCGHCGADMRGGGEDG